MNSPISPSVVIKRLFDEDQSERSLPFNEINPQTIIDNDRARVVEAHSIYTAFKESKVELSGDDLFYLAILFQHGSNSEDFLIATELATLSSEKGNNKAKWLAAATEDRYLLSKGEKQKWGTQFSKKSPDDEWELSPMASDEESGISDAMRKDKNVPERAKQFETFLSRNH
jgi:hypothetical protein